MIIYLCNPMYYITYILRAKIIRLSIIQLCKLINLLLAKQLPGVCDRVMLNVY